MEDVSQSSCFERLDSEDVPSSYRGRVADVHLRASEHGRRITVVVHLAAGFCHVIGVI